MTSPLSKFYRTPGIHISLPSKFKFNDPSEFELSMSNELAVFPMTAKDELWTKNPDALLNGHAIVEIIKSCIPGIKNPRAMVSNDVDYALLAIKKVSYGDYITIPATCPKCGSHHDYEHPIDALLNQVTEYPDDNSVRFNDSLVAYIRPHTYESSTKMNIAAFEETKLLEAVTDMNLSKEARMAMFSNSYDKISNLNLELIAYTVVKIVGPDFIVDDHEEIKNFILNTPKEYAEKIKEKVLELSEFGLNKNIELQCGNKECNHIWTTELVYDPAHFFA